MAYGASEAALIALPAHQRIARGLVALFARRSPQYSAGSIAMLVGPKSLAVNRLNRFISFSAG